jgi:streptogramin lyase
MNRSSLRSHLATLLTALIAGLGLLGLSTAPALAAAGTVREFNVPTASSMPEGITAGPDGNLWFTEQLAGEIGRITPS